MNKEDEKVLQPKIASREVTMHILKAFGLRMSKKLGQNFLIDARIVQGIVDAAEVKPGDRVLEIGPGLGVNGPYGNYSMFSDASKLLLSFVMLLGRLELYPILVMLMPSTWRR